MNYWNLFYIALRAILSNKMRTFLTMLGMIIGVSSVITMLAIGQGSKRSIREQISEMGSNMIMVYPNRGRMGGVRMNSADMQVLKSKDFEDLQKECPHVNAITPQVSSSGQLINGTQNAPSTAYGVNEDYLTIRKYKVAEGTFFSDEHVKTYAKVAVIGKTVVNNLFNEGEDPIGKVIRFNKIPLTIIGVLESKGSNSMGQDQDDIVLMPYTTVQKRILAQTHFQSIVASATSESETELAIEEISSVLRRNHQIGAYQEDDFDIRSQEELVSALSSTTDMMTVLLACIASISLLVGGIGIMNIMFVSVTERTKEIGLRMSIGAKERHIMLQFLIEAVMISVSGGIIGVLFGLLASYGINFLVGWPVYVQAWSVALSFAVCTTAGIFFGWYPARKAARLDPIEAIRYE
ncbi:MAG: ABC transporter permease [Paludibacteraceae bacterium]|nr:ABC transporter permease [Paludibacteraceae bacterium]